MRLYVNVQHDSSSETKLHCLLLSILSNLIFHEAWQVLHVQSKTTAHVYIWCKRFPSRDEKHCE